MRLNMEGLKERILYEDSEILVVDKPAGTAVESARVTEPDLVSLLRTYLGRPVYVVHRLDQPVRGVMVFAKTSRAASSLSSQVSGNGRDQMKKIYHARVSGPVPAGEGTLTDYLLRDPKTNMSRVVNEKDLNQYGKGTKPKKAVLHYRKTGEQELEVELLTGRHHQIRVQLAHAGMPIEGDRKYGGSEAETLALCAAEITFRHPKTGEKMTWRINPQK